MKSLVIVKSIHHQNTLKIAHVIADVLDAPVREPEDICPSELGTFDLIGFGSGIYGSKHHTSLLDLAERLETGFGKNVFLFSTCGAPAFAFEGGHIDDYVEKSHRPLRTILESKGCQVIDEFICPGWNTNRFLKLFGGINKGRPDDKDYQKARSFAEDLKK
jgi:flavodoxin